mmetsp:Transcript_5210/g.7694  ORF Transcript_5210/g.7694 Transcript_5210/m.7694 type:complete len:276 (+) Transcript_5210:649-1476(+)
MIAAGKRKYTLTIRATNGDIPDLVIRDLNGDISIQDLKRKIAELHEVREIFEDPAKPPRYFFAGVILQGNCSLDEFMNKTTNNHLKLDHIENSDNYVSLSSYTITMSTPIKYKVNTKEEKNTNESRDNQEESEDEIEKVLHVNLNVVTDSDEEPIPQDASSFSPYAEIDIYYHFFSWAKLLLGSAVFTFTFVEEYENFFRTLIRIWTLITTSYLIGLVTYVNFVSNSTHLVQSEEANTGPQGIHNHIIHILKLYVCTLNPEYEVRPLPRNTEEEE